MKNFIKKRTCRRIFFRTTGAFSINIVSADSAKHDSENQNQHTDRHVDIFADRIIQIREFAMTRDLIEKALEMGKTVAVPRVEGDDMVYYEIKDFSTLKSGYFGIMEPDGGKVCTREEGFLLVPGVAFDSARHRVGYGKGFYDRFLAAHPGFTTVAAAFEFQLFDAVPFEETDILPQMLVTEQKIYR